MTDERNASWRRFAESRNLLTAYDTALQTVRDLRRPKAVREEALRKVRALGKLLGLPQEPYDDGGNHGKDVFRD
jgi:hypothetical protein